MPSIHWSGASTTSRRYPQHLTSLRPFALLSAALALFSGCALTPRQTAEEQKKLDETGVRYEPRFEERALPDLPAPADWQDVLRRSFLANGDLEAAYFDWKAALQRVRVAGAWPNTDVELGYSYEFSKEHMNTFDRMTFTAGFDPSINLTLPTKTMQAAKVALDEAQVAGERFRVAKFDLQRKVLYAWSDYILQARQIQLKQQDLALRRVLVESATARVQAGERQRDVLESALGQRVAESDVRDLEAEHEQTRLSLNAMMARGHDAPLLAPAVHPPTRPIPSDDAALIAAAADVFPEVVEFAREVQSRQDALELARLRWIPDFNPSVAFTGSIAQAIGIGVILPTTIAAIQGQIDEAQSALRAAEARLRQRRFDRVSEYVSLLVMLRNAQRREQLFQNTILPLAQRISDDQQRAYEVNAATLADVIETRRMLLDLQLTIAQSQATIDKAIVEIECCLGADIETLGSTPSPITTPASASSPLIIPNQPLVSVKKTDMTEVQSHE